MRTVDEEVVMEDRSKTIIHAGYISLAVNLALGILKVVVGFTTNSIAILLDAVNSLTDMFASVVTLAGTKVSDLPANEKHPFGFGRAEYLTSITISAIILAAGITSLFEAIKAILHPETPEYTVGSLVIVACATLGKGILGLYLKRTGKACGSAMLVGSGVDAIMDGFVSLSTLIAAIVYITLNISVESLLAAAIALLVIKNGINLLTDTVSKVLGERVDPSIASKVERIARSVDEVELASGLVLQDNGPERIIGSIHITVDGAMTVAELNAVTRTVQKRVYEECGVMLTSIGAYPTPQKDAATRKVRALVGKIVWRHPQIVELRGLFVDTQAKHVRFDAIAGFGVIDRTPLREDIVSLCTKELPGWTVDVHVLPYAGD